MNRALKILRNNLLTQYAGEVSADFLCQYQNLNDSELSIDAFSFYTSVSAVFSSKIEGEIIENLIKRDREMHKRIINN